MAIEPGSDLRSNVGQEECLIHSFLGGLIDEKPIEFHQIFNEKQSFEPTCEAFASAAGTLVSQHPKWLISQLLILSMIWCDMNGVSHAHVSTIVPASEIVLQSGAEGQWYRFILRKS